MDTTTRERDIVKQVIQRYAQFKPALELARSNLQQ
jgi:hypothetical protein